MDLPIKEIGEIIFLLAMLGFFGSLEWRLRGKVGKGRFERLEVQFDRMESNQYQLLLHLKVPDIIEPPEEVKNNNKNNSGKTSD